MRILVLAFFLSACGIFEYSPYSVTPEGDERDLGLANLERIRQGAPSPGSAFTLAVFSDVHNAYDELEDAVRHINSDTSIRFLLITGDLTQNGLLQEYQWAASRLSRLAVPYLTAQGNHDAQANGKAIYRRMFGPADHSFTYLGVKFIFFNANVWEYPCCTPDLPWLEAELAGAGDSLRIFTVSHIPPFGDQFDPALSRTTLDLFEKYGVEISIHGHHHNYHLRPHEGGKVPYLLADNIGDRNYVRISVSDTGLSVNRVFF